MQRKSRELNDNQKNAHEFLKQRASDHQPFTVEEFADATGWNGSTPQTYLSKQFDDYLRKLGNKQYTVKAIFLSLNDEQFFDLVTQNRRAVTDYRRIMFDHVVIYEFLLPLTKEDILRDRLDVLFYRDSLKLRLGEIGLEQVALYFDRNTNEADDNFLSRIIDYVSDRFGGYSISHVQGRFRAEAIMSIQQSTDLLKTNRKYLVDETTAVVRFIIPCAFSQKELDDDFSQVYTQSPVLFGETPEEVAAIRFFFFELFVEAIVEVVKGEDEVWLLERAGLDRLYVWKRE